MTKNNLTLDIARYWHASFIIIVILFDKGKRNSFSTVCIQQFSCWCCLSTSTCVFKLFIEWLISWGKACWVLYIGCFSPQFLSTTRINLNTQRTLRHSFCQSFGNIMKFRVIMPPKAQTFWTLTTMHIVIQHIQLAAISG